MNPEAPPVSAKGEFDMASYLELFTLKNDSDLQDRILVATVVAAEAIRTDADPPANQVQREAWARQALLDPVTESRRMLWAVLAANKSATTASILAVEDTVLQGSVNAVVDLFAGA